MWVQRQRPRAQNLVIIDEGIINMVHEVVPDAEISGVDKQIKLSRGRGRGRGRDAYRDK